MDWAGDHLSPLILHNQMKYHLWVDVDIIFRYRKWFFDIPKLLWDDIRSYNITDGWMLISSLKMQNCFLIFLNLTKFPQGGKSTASSGTAKIAVAASSTRRYSAGWGKARSQHTHRPKRSSCWFFMSLFASSLFSGTNVLKRNFINLVTTQSFSCRILRLYVICECIRWFFTLKTPVHWDLISNYKAEILG